MFKKEKIMEEREKIIGFVCDMCKKEFKDDRKEKLNMIIFYLTKIWR